MIEWGEKERVEKERKIANTHTQINKRYKNTLRKKSPHVLGRPDALQILTEIRYGGAKEGPCEVINDGEV